MIRRAILVTAVLGLVAAVATFWLLWGSPGPREGPHHVVVEEGSTLATVASSG